MRLKNFLRRLLGRKTSKINRYNQLFNALREVRPRAIMEIGTWKGGRALEMISLAKQYQPAQDIHYYGFDLFTEMTAIKYQEEISKWPPSLPEVKQKLEQSGAQIHLYQGDSAIAIPRVIGNLPPMDFVFIDGGHSLATIESDWRNTQKLMLADTVVIFDDYWPDRTDAGCKVTVDRIDPARYDIRILPVIDEFDNAEFGKLRIQLVRVKLKAS